MFHSPTQLATSTERVHLDYLVGAWPSSQRRMAEEKAKVKESTTTGVSFPNKESTTFEGTSTTGVSFPNKESTTTGVSFPNIGVSLEVLTSLRDDPVMKKTMLELVHPEITLAALKLKELADLRNLAQELRLFSDHDGGIEFSMYKKESLSKEFFISALCSITPTTTTHVNIAIVKPQTKGSGACYAISVLKSHPDLVGIPTDFVSHAWRYTFAELVDAIELEHNERILADSDSINSNSDQLLLQQKQVQKQQKRFYWNDIFVEDQNTTMSRPEGYFFTAFREAIASIGRTVLVLEPIQTPIPLTRAWCIWEIWSTIDSKSDLVVVMPPSEEATFEQLIMDDFNSIVEALSQVDSMNSQAFVEDDRISIHRIIQEQCEGGHVEVDRAICDSMRQWFTSACQRILRKLQLEEARDDDDDDKEEENIRAQGAQGAQGAQDQGTETETRKKWQMVNNVGKLVRKMGELNETEKLYRLCYQERTKAFGKNDKDTLESTNNLAFLLRQLGKFSEAIIFAKQGLDGKLILLGEQNNSTWLSMNQLAMAYKERRNFDMAENLFYQIMQLMNKFPLDNKIKMINWRGLMLNNLGDLLREKNMFDEAEVMLRKAVIYWETEKKEIKPPLLRSFRYLALTLIAVGNVAEGIEYFRKEVIGFEKLFGYYSPDAARARNNLGDALRVDGQFIEALLLLKESTKSLEQIFGKEHPNVIYATGNYGLLLVSEYGNLIEQVEVGKNLLNEVLIKIEASNEIWKFEHRSREIHPWVKKFTLF